MTAGETLVVLKRATKTTRVSIASHARAIG